MLLAKHIMRKESVRPDDTVREAIVKLWATGLPGIPVINEESEVIGVVTEFDLLGALREGLQPDKLKVARIMIKNPVTADINANVHELISTMLSNNFTVMPVVKGKTLAGVVSRLMLLNAYVSLTRNVLPDEYDTRLGYKVPYERCYSIR